MQIIKAQKDGATLNCVSVSDEADVTAVTKAVAALSNKGAYYPLTPTLYSSGAEGFLLNGFCTNELDEIATRIRAKRPDRQETTR